VIRNNVISGNSSLNVGGGLCSCDGLIVNNTIVGNSATGIAPHVLPGLGGGLCECTGTITNCIIWGNTALSEGDQPYVSSDPTYSCVQGGTPGEGNIADDPQFADPDADNYRLRCGSPCIDSGKNDDWMWDAVDLDGNPRIMNGIVDMGAYEGAQQAPLTWYVDGSVPSPGDGRSWAKAFRSIQQGIEEACPADTINVAPGTYYENVNFNGKNLSLLGAGPDGTIIDGNQSGTVVTFDGSEKETCVLSGFTIRNGDALDDGGGISGGAVDNRTHATIKNSVVTGNSAASGGGLAFFDGEIYNCTIAGNSADWGGGLFECDGPIRNCIIVGNSAQDGAGLAFCDGMVKNCTITQNAGVRGGGLAYCYGTILECIIWGNTAIHGAQLLGSSDPTYSCIQDWTGGAQGNIPYSAYFVDADNADYHLKSWSPCIDSGDPASDFSNEPEPNGGRINMGAYGNTPEAASASPDSDTDGLPDDWEREFFANLGQGPSDDPDGDLIPNIEEYYLGSDPTVAWYWYVDASVVSPGDGTSWEKAFRSIQKAIDVATHHDVINVAPGTYYENINFNGKNLALLGAGAETTIIDGNQAGTVVTFSGTETDCELSGFTIRNGHAYFPGAGGGIFGWGARVDIHDNVITGNSATHEGGGLWNCCGYIENNEITENRAGTAGGAAYGQGGGLAHCYGHIEHNLIANNLAVNGEGGGLYGCRFWIIGNEILGNWAEENGGGICEVSGITQHDAAIQDNVIAGNSAGRFGGGLYHCYGIIERNLISENRAEGTGSGGGGLAKCSFVMEEPRQNTTIRYNTITRNSAESGGGLFGCHASIYNNIIAANVAAPGGGGGLYDCSEFTLNTICGNSGAAIADCNGWISNCIVWGNLGGSLLPGCAVPWYCCIEGWTGGGEGNITCYPYFVDAPGGDYHLTSWSPCIDAGDPLSSFSQEPQPNGGRINMGAYGNTPEATSASHDSDSDGLPDDWEREFFGDLGQGPSDDTDTDLIANIEEYCQGLDPTAPRYWYVDASVSLPGDGTSWAKAFRTIQEAIDGACPCEAVNVAPGTYHENIRLDGKNLSLLGAGADTTIIDGNQAAPVVSFDGTENQTCVLSGFTIRNGKAPEDGGGICGGTVDNRAHATIQNSVITGNSAGWGGRRDGLFRRRNLQLHNRREQR
jgi:hypothetical protein